MLLRADKETQKNPSRSGAMNGDSTLGEHGVKLVLDWRAYYYSFVEKHGEPIELAGCLLFPDGWRYAKEDYQGPEYPPPEDPRELLELQLQYWTVKKATVESELKHTTNQMQALQGWQENRDLPLQQVLIYKTRDEEGKVRMQRGEPEDLDLSAFEVKCEDLSALLTECEQQLKELRKRNNERS